ncbi:MAG: hypothetical protein H7289_15330 [Mucilaginibacter sp.]|nr:hypothetical protein [Mucilaginibacter sp.]
MQALEQALVGIVDCDFYAVWSHDDPSFHLIKNPVILDIEKPYLAINN